MNVLPLNALSQYYAGVVMKLGRKKLNIAKKAILIKQQAISLKAVCYEISLLILSTRQYKQNYLNFVQGGGQITVKHALLRFSPHKSRIFSLISL